MSKSEKDLNSGGGEEKKNEDINVDSGAGRSGFSSDGTGMGDTGRTSGSASSSSAASHPTVLNSGEYSDEKKRESQKKFDRRAAEAQKMKEAVDKLRREKEFQLREQEAELELQRKWREMQVEAQEAKEQRMKDA